MDFLSAMALARSPDDIVYGREMILDESPEWPLLVEMHNAHSRELGGKPVHINVAAYKKMHEDGQLVVVRARRRDTGQAVGYVVHTLFYDWHYSRRVAMEDSWYVMPAYRRRGVGRRLLETALQELKKLGVKATLLRLKYDHQHPNVMQELGYRPNEIVYRKEL